MSTMAATSSSWNASKASRAPRSRDQGWSIPEVTVEIGVRACAGLLSTPTATGSSTDVKPGNLMVIGGPVGGGEMTWQADRFPGSPGRRADPDHLVGSGSEPPFTWRPEQVRGEAATPSTDVYA